MPKNPHADFSPVLDGYSGIGAFRFWCQTALPLTYDDSLSYYELLNKVVNYLNHTIEDLTAVESNTSALANAYNQLQKYVNDYFDDLDVEAELRNVLDAMAEDGTLDALLSPIVENQLPGVVDEKIDAVVAEQIDGAVAGQIDESVEEQLPALVEAGIPEEVRDWLGENVNPVGSAVVVDSSLTISGAAADAKATGDELSDLKTQLTPIEEQFSIKYITGKFINTNGDFAVNEQYAYTDLIPCNADSVINIYGVRAGASVFACAFYDAEKGYINNSGINNVDGDVENIVVPNEASYVAFSSRITDGITTTWDPSAYVYNYKKIENSISSYAETIDNLDNRVSTAEEQISDLTNKKIAPIDTTFFDLGDIIGESFVEFVSGLIDGNGKFQMRESFLRTSIKIKIKPNTTYILNIPNANRNTGTSNNTGVFANDTAYDTLTVTRNGDTLTFTTGDDVSYAIIYFYDSTYDTSSTNGIHLYENSVSAYTFPTIKENTIPHDYDNLNILVFGDSISDTINMTIDSETNTTTSYSEKNPNNSYVKNGVTIQYAMWPTLVQRVLRIKELRNYAKSGAHFYTTSSTPADPRQKLLYQVQVALNDLDNPNNVFPTTGDFVPDIVIVACGINDGNISSGAFETTMAKTVMNQAGTGVDIEATMNAMNQQAPMDAMRYVLMLLKQTFPEALFLYVNPLQQTYSTNENRLIARNELGKMAEQYDFVNLDGFGQFGVVRDFETQGQIGLLTKDGLHPNEKGQNLYARNIVQAIKRYYFPLDSFNP